MSACGGEADIGAGHLVNRLTTNREITRPSSNFTLAGRQLAVFVLREITVKQPLKCPSQLTFSIFVFETSSDFIGGF